MKTRLQLLAIIAQYVLSGGRRTLASGVRIVFGWIIGSNVNILDDANVANGYLQLDSGGLIPSAFLPSGLRVVTIDITGLNGIDLTGLKGSVIINLTSSNTTETINALSNIAAGLDFIWLCPSLTLTLTVNDKSVSGGNIRVYNSTVAMIGAKEGSLQLMQRASGKFYQQNYIDQYV